MQINNTYPPVSAKKEFLRMRMLRVARCPFLVAAAVCPVINYLVGGKAWSLVVLIGLHMTWTLLFDVDLVEYNRISQLVRLIASSCMLLAVIELFIASGWALQVIALVCMGGLIAAAILFFTDIDTQKQNMLPMLLLVLITITGAVTVWLMKGSECEWPVTAMGLTAISLLISLIAVLRSEFLLELKRRFHVK